MNARKVFVDITINSVDVSKDVAPFLKSFSFTDNLSGEADSAEINLHDAAGLWRGDWFPTRGDSAIVSIRRENWEIDTGVETFPLGTFEIDEVSCKYPPSEASIKLVSIPNNAKIRNINKSRAWENVTLSKIAGDIATDSGLSLFFDVPSDPKIERAEQKKQSSLAFLMNLCKENGLALKVSDEQIIIFDELKFESQSPVKTLNFGSSAIKFFSGRSTIHEIYSACHVSYKHGKKSELIEFTYTDPTKSEGMTLEINKKVSSVAEAEKLAKKMLREKNTSEVKVTLNLIGDFIYSAGNVIELAGHGAFDGNYLIEKATHKIGGGYETSVDLRRILNGY